MKRWLTPATCVVALLGAVAACSSDNREQVLGSDGDGGAVGSFTPDAGDAAAEALAPEASTVLECISTTCPAPLATCSSSDLPCSIDLSSDSLHCGACDIVCPSLPGSAFSCAHGTCVEVCGAQLADCDGLLETGCETQITFFDATGAAVAGDVDNCGGCGIKCTGGAPCFGSKCGCPSGQTLCSDGSCVNTSGDTANCGACGHACNFVLGPHDPPPAPNESLQCSVGKCVTQCTWPFAECNGNLQDGCETPLGTEQNCAHCGDQCAPNVKCYTVDEVSHCGCTGGKVDCDGACTDLDNVHTCGACNNDCTLGADIPAGGADYVGNTTASCDRGRCSYDCKPGFADKNGLQLDGCEVAIMNDPDNCGGSGVTCDRDAGQPCVNGKCLTEPCPKGPTR